MSQYLLSPHSYLCFADDYAVFLDLKRDKYTALAPEDTRTLSTLVRGWPSADKSIPLLPQPPTQSRSDIISMLLDEELLTDNERVGKSAIPISLDPVTATIAAIPGPFPKIDFGDFVKFVSAWAVTTLMLRCLPLRITVGRARKRKERKQRSGAEFDVLKVRQLMMAYFILRPNFFSNVDACLRDSLTFVEFLSRYGLYPTWVFGVRMNPFAAHAWVQEGPMVLNDDVVHINQFIPIMAI